MNDLTLPQVNLRKEGNNMLFLNEKDGAWEVWRGENLCSARLVRVFQTYAEALAYYDRLEKKLQETERQILAATSRHVGSFHPLEYERQARGLDWRQYDIRL